MDKSGTVDADELAQSYLELKQISEDSNRVALIKGARNRRERLRHVERALESAQYVQTVREVRREVKWVKRALVHLSKQVGEINQKVRENNEMASASQMHFAAIAQRQQWMLADLAGAEAGVDHAATYSHSGFGYHGHPAPSVLAPGGVASSGGAGDALPRGTMGAGRSAFVERWWTERGDK